MGARMNIFGDTDVAGVWLQMLLSPLGLLVITVFLARIGLDQLMPARRRRSKEAGRTSHSPSWFRLLLSLAFLTTALWMVGAGLKLVTWMTSPSGSAQLQFSVFDAVLSFVMPLVWIGAGIGVVRGMRHWRRGRGLGMSVARMKQLTPEDFETFVAELFRERGYQARMVGGEGDHGVDLVVTNPAGERELVQCKRWGGKWIGEAVVRDFYGALMHDGQAVRGYIVTTSFFSRAARAWAKGKPIDLIDGPKLAEAAQGLAAAKKGPQGASGPPRATP